MPDFFAFAPGRGPQMLSISSDALGNLCPFPSTPKSHHANFTEVAKRLTKNGLVDIAGLHPSEIAPYIEDLEVMRHLQRNSILIASEELWTLVLRGFDKKILGIIEKLPEEIQARVLGKDRMIWALCYSDHAADVVRLIGKMNERNQKRLFDLPGVVSSLLRHDQEKAVDRIMRLWHRRKIDFTMPFAPKAG